MATDTLPKPETHLSERAWQLYREQDSGAACEFLEGAGDVLAVAQAYSAFLQWIYWQKKDLGAMLTFGRMGQHYCLCEARREPLPQRAAELRGVAKTIAYNLGSNTWPGWDEKGIRIGSSDRDAGADAARLNLRLAQELNRPADRLGNAYWLIGAHQLAAGHLSAAATSFVRARELFQQAQKEDYVLMAEGYAALTEVVEGKAHGSVALGEILERLKQQGTEDASFFADQLEVARRVFGGARG